MFAFNAQPFFSSLNQKSLQRKFFLVFPVLLSLTSAGTLWAKASLRLKIFANSKSDPPTQIWVRGNGYSKVFSLSDQSSELTIDLKEQGVYDVILTFKSGEMEHKFVTVDSDEKNLEFVQKTKKVTNGINVVGKRPEAPPNYVLSQEDAIRMPGGFGDALKAVQSMPGISPMYQMYTGASFQSAIQTFAQATNPDKPDKPNGEKGFLVMRGAGARANQFYFNGLPMSYPFHADGLTSVINNNAIRSLELYSGSYSARYGFATGGIINIEGFQKRDSNLSVAHLNAFLTDVYTYRNITKDLNVSVSGKKYYPNIVFGRVPNLIPAETFLADYNDYQARIGWDISENHSLSFQTFGAKDKRYPFKELSQYNPKETAQSFANPPSDADAARLDRIFRTDGIQHIWKPKSSITNTFNVSRNYFNEVTENGLDMLVLDITKIGYPPSLYKRVQTIQNEYFNDLRQIENVSEVELLKRNWKIVFGGQYREVDTGYKGKVSQINLDPTYNFIHQQLLNSSDVKSVLEGDSVRTRQIGTFFENRFKFYDFNLNLGVRREYYDKSREWKTAPRIGISKEIAYTQSRIFAGYGKHFQAPSDVSRYSARTGNPNLKMEESEHAEIGWDQKIGNFWNIKIEGYQNTFSNLSIADPYTMDPFSRNRDLMRESLDPNADLSLVRRSNLNYSNSMTGYSRGVEVFIKKEASAESGLYGWISYTKSITKRNRNLPELTKQEYSSWLAESSAKDLIHQENTDYYYANFYRDGSYDVLFKNSKEELYDFDRTHMFNMVIGWKFGEKAQIGLRGTYLTNYAYTPVVGSKSITSEQFNSQLLPSAAPPPPSSSSSSSSSLFSIYQPVYSDMLRSARLPHYHQFDLRFDRFIPTSWGRMTAYLELVNITGSRIAVSADTFVPIFPFVPGANPETQYIYLNGLQSLRTEKNKIPYLNFGIEFRF
ncbi:TonB-dependent receptor [Leptospira interrogans serovar Grippotyphosa str. 2006006986]|nr:TonB-dependent receptor plug domain-containing protein [Leptospira interrogans]EKO88474.1 TonB-dependent receptor [Leptospira interrogans serovar Grippotyphosa str. Andaman]EKP84490.1 TonB-dependent receptor [Leptospira interrogans serovar Grippotyphosa str. 2006006986]